MTPASSEPIILASGSPIRARLLANAGLQFDTYIPRIDEAALRDALVAEDATPRDIADTLAEMKAQRIASRHPDAVVIGCDQVLCLGNRIFAKAESSEEARSQLHALRNRQHELLSAVVVYKGDRPLWRQVGVVRLTMAHMSDDWLDGYLARNWDSVRDAVGCYKLEEEGVRLFSRIEGDYFTVLGLPLVELLSYLALRGTISS
jgi:septum formation protein